MPEAKRHLLDLPNELLLQIFRVEDEERNPDWWQMERHPRRFLHERERLIDLPLVCKRFAAIGLDILLDYIALPSLTPRIKYEMTERSLARIEAVSRNASIATRIKNLHCTGYFYDSDLSDLREYELYWRNDHMRAKECFLRTDPFHKAQGEFVAHGQASERLARILPRFPNLHELFYTRKQTNAKDYPHKEIRWRRPQNAAASTRHQSEDPIPTSSFHAWTGMIDILRTLVATRSRIDTLKLHNIVPDLTICSPEERAVFRRFAKETPTLQVLYIRPSEPHRDDNVRLKSRVPDRASEIRTWNNIFGDLSSLKTLIVIGLEVLDDELLGDSSIMRMLLKMRWPRLEGLQIRGMGVQHKAFLAFLLNHRDTLAKVTLDNCHTIVSAGALYLHGPDDYSQEYTKCVYGDWVECATLLLTLQRQYVLRKLSLEFSSSHRRQRVSEENRRLLNGLESILQQSWQAKSIDVEFADVLLRYCAQRIGM